MKALLDSLKALGLPRLIAMGTVAVVALGMLGFLALQAGNQPMSLLYGDLGLRDAASVVDALKGAHIPYTLGARGTEILVPANQVAPARLLLAKVGLPTGGSIGFRIFDHTNLLGQTAFQQRIDETRALEGELEQTIQLIQGVRAAKVNLVLPRREPFSQTSQPASASVLLTMAGAMPLDAEGVSAIINLVSAAVPGLRPQDIAIVDSRGDLLARAGAPVGAIGQASSAEEIRRRVELRLTRAVEAMLSRALGPGHVRAETSVSMNFDQQRQTQTTYDPNGQVLRSQQTSSSKSSSTNSSSNVSVQNNLPNANAGKTTPGSQHATQSEIDNYEISKTVRTLIHNQPRISRISVAVMVDGTETKGPNGKSVWKPRSKAELTQIADLVKSAIGYNKARGDHVYVTSMRFVQAASGLPAKRPTLFGVPLPDAAAMPLIETGIFGLVALLTLLFVFRPMVLRLGLPQLAAEGAEGASEAIAGASGRGALPTGGGGTSLLTGPAGAAAGGDESMVDVNQIEGQMRASSLRRVVNLAETHPDETLAILRGWMTQEAG